MIRIRSLIFAPIAVLGVLAGGLLFTSVPAAQAASPTEIGSFGPGGLTTPPFFAFPTSIVVEQSTGDVYIYEVGENEATGEIGNVYKFSANGEPENFIRTGSNAIEGLGEGEGGGASQIAVDNSSGPAKGDIYIATGAKVLIYNSEGKELPPLTEANSPRGVAVDSNGAVYVSFNQLKTVDKYTPTANPVTTADLTCSLEPSEEPSIENVAVNSAEDIYLAVEGGGQVRRFEASECDGQSASGTQVIGGGRGRPSTLVVDPKTNDVYINEGFQIFVFNSSNTQIEEFGSLGESFGVAVSDASGHEGDIYAPASKNESVVSIFGSASAEETLGITTSTGTGTGKVQCKVNGGGSFTSCASEYAAGTELTLEAEPEPGSEFISMSGTGSALTCTSSPCTFTIAESSSVTAIFNTEVVGKGGATGPTGPAGPSGPTGPAGPTGNIGSTGNTGPSGPKGEAGEEGEEGKEGKAGANGTNGEKGVPGPAGAAGTQGPVGPVGAQGPAGPPGKVELVTCKTVKKKGKSVQQCTTKLVSGTVKFTATGASAQATLSRHGAVYAAGMARIAHGRTSLRLTPLRRLRPGRYTLTLIGGAGRHETIRREAFTLR